MSDGCESSSDFERLERRLGESRQDVERLRLYLKALIEVMVGEHFSVTRVRRLLMDAVYRGAGRGWRQGDGKLVELAEELSEELYGQFLPSTIRAHERRQFGEPLEEEAEDESEP